MFEEYMMIAQGRIDSLEIDDLEQCVLNYSKYIECSGIESNYFRCKVSAYPMVLGKNGFYNNDKKEEVHIPLESGDFLHLYKLKKPLEFNELYDSLCLISLAFFLYKYRDRDWAKRLLIETLKFIVESYNIDIEILDSEEFLYDFITKQLLEFVSVYNMYDEEEFSSYGLKFILQDVRLTTFGHHYLYLKDHLVRLYKCDSGNRYREGTFWDDIKYLQLSDDVFVIISGDMEEITPTYMGVFKETKASIEVLSEVVFTDSEIIRIEIVEDLDIH